MSQMYSRAKGVIGVFDISSSSVAGAHVLLTPRDPKTKAVFLASTRSDATLQEDIDVNRFVSETIAHIELVANRLKKADTHKLSHIQIVLASPWYSSHTRTIRYEKDDTQFFCTQKLIDTLVDAELKQILAEGTGAFGEFGTASIVVERQISQIKLNGYATANPFGKKTRTLEIFLTLTVAPKPIIDRFKESLIRIYGHSSIGVTTSPYTTYVVARDTIAIDDECVIVDVGEEVTDIAFVKEGLFLYQHSFPIGTYALYRIVGEQEKNGSQAARALLEAYRLEKLSPQAKTALDTAIAEFRLKWQKALQETLDTGQYGLCMPEHCFITADPRFELIFTTIIETDPFIQHTCSRGVVRPHFVASTLIGDRVQTIDGTTIDAPLAVGALFMERLI